jgi:hypothetical protein
MKIVRAMLGCYGLAYLLTALLKPLAHWEHFSPGNDHGSTIPVWLKIALAFLCVGVLMHFALFAITDAIPDGAYIDEDGDEQPPHILNWTATFFVTLAVVQGTINLSRNAALSARPPQ